MDSERELENSVVRHSSALTSSRSTDRKKSAESLKELLERNALPSLLTKNTLQRKDFTWNTLFDDINDYIHKEAEKFESSKTFDKVTAPLCTSLLHMVVAGSNKGRAYIKCDRIVDACLSILKDARLTKAFGDAYLNLLYKHILPCDHYLGFITVANWEDLLNVCIKICSGNNSKLDTYTKLKLVLLIIKRAKQYCQFVIPLRDSLSKLEKCLIEVQNDKRVQEIMVDILINLLELLSTESRLTMCNYTEKFMPVILKFYEQNLDHKKKMSLFRLLEMVVIVHHPRGKLANKDGSMAGDWVVWNKHLKSILEIVSLEVAVLQKVRKQSDAGVTCNEYFYSLAASVYNQIFNSISNSDNAAEEGNSSKRLKIGLNKYITLSDLIHQLQVNYIPWLGIIHVYVKKYENSIHASDAYSLIRAVENLVSNDYQNLDWAAVIEIMELALSKQLSASQSEELSDTLLSIWNSCVRNSTTCNSANKYLHSIIQVLLKTKVLTYQNIQSLMKLYLEKSMPVNDSSVKTLNIILDMFFNKCSRVKVKTSLFDWFIRGVTGSVNKDNIVELLNRLISNENVNFVTSHSQNRGHDSLFDTLFNEIDNCILFSEFEYKKPSSLNGNLESVNNVDEHTELNSEINELIQNSLEATLKNYTEKYNSKEIQYTQYLQLIDIVIAYVDALCKARFLTVNLISELRLFSLLEISLKSLFMNLSNTWKNDTKIETKIKILQDLKELMIAGYAPFIGDLIRKSINDEFFYCVTSNLTDENAPEDVIYEGDDTEVNTITLKFHCLYFLASYCRRRAAHRDQLLELILDPKYHSDFSSVWDVKCAFKTIDILFGSGAEEPPLEDIFVFMQHLCQYLFRSPKATFGLMDIFLRIVKRLWSDDNNMKQNCFIMVRGYLERCAKQFYPPNVAAIIYKCAAEVVSLNASENSEINDKFVKAILKRTKGDIHCLRLYCIYLLKMLNYIEIDADVYLAGLSDIFVISVPERNQTILKDESMNRTLTVLHGYAAMALANNALIQKIINSALQVLKEKSLDESMAKKILNTITISVVKKDLGTYMNTHILDILNFWFIRKYPIRELPLSFFDIQDQGAFLEKHMNWLVSTDILWRSEGNIKDSDVLKQAEDRLVSSESKIVEACFCNIVVLCLPYIVAEKYKLRYTNVENHTQFKNIAINAQRMFQMTRQILENEKWSNLFVEHIGELLLLSACHLNDCNDTKERFHVDVPKNDEIYQYPKNIFSAILTYFGELTSSDIMQYLCENQSVAIFKILFKLWDRVLQEAVFEYKVMAINAFVTFTENIPLVSPSDSFVCNYVCNCFGCAIKSSMSKDEIRVLTLALKMILEKLLPEKVDVLRKALADLMSVLVIKNEEGFTKECKLLLDYLMVDVTEFLKEGEDVVDYFKSMSERSVENIQCYSLTEFSERLKTYKLALTCPSQKTLSNLKEFLKTNKHFVNDLCNKLNMKGFSEECGHSLIHQTIYTLNNILKYGGDRKTVIEACRCLVEIGTYDLKTLVTVPPADAAKVANVSPKQSFAEAVVSSLSENMFDENPVVTNKITKTLHSLLKFRDGVRAVESYEIEKTILKPFVSDQDVISAEFKIDDTKLSACRQIDFLVPSGDVSHGEWLKNVTVHLLDIFDAEMNYLDVLKDVCALKPEVCQKILPHLFSLLLSCSAEKHMKVIGDQISRFFKYIWDTSFDDQVESSGDSTVNIRTKTLDQDNKLIIQYMLEAVNVIRLQKSHYKSRASRLETLNFLKLEYDKVAWAATVADQNLAAVYYAELWAAALNYCVPPASPEATSALDGGKDLQRILRKSFVSIGEMDAIDGCGTAHLTMDQEKRKHLINIGQYQDALLHHDIALSCSHADPQLQWGAARSLHKSGMHHLALQYIKSLPETDQLNDIKYECLSFLGDWSEFIDTQELEEKSKESNCNTQSILKAFRYACLKYCLNIEMKPEFENKLVNHLNRAKLAVSRYSQKLNMENCQNVYKVLSKLQLFYDIEEYNEVKCNKLPLYDLIHKWRVENLPMHRDFKYVEDLISQRNIILEHSAKVYEDSSKEIASLQLQYAELCLSNQRIQIAQRLVAAVKNLRNSDKVTLLESQIAWGKGHQDIAISMLRSNVTTQERMQSADLRLKAVSLRQYGLWMAESKSENPRDIINKYLKQSLEILNETDDRKIKLKVYFDIAKFADAEYKQVLAYMNSSIFENKVKCFENVKDTYTSLKSTQTSQLSREERRALLTSERFKALDESEIANTRAEKECFLQLAVRYYLLSLKECEENNLSVFRVISLWLENPSLVLDEAEGGSFEDLLHAIPSRKFITVLPQLMPRLTDENTPFAENLRKIITRCAREHPHHTLPILFSLKNSDKDKCILNAGEGGRREPRGAQEPRVAAAERLVRRLAEDCAELAVVCAQMERLCDATISLANFKPKEKSSKQKIPAAEGILKLLQLDAIPIPTDTVPIRHDCNYRSISTLVVFDKYFELVGGINCPKKMNCLGSDGKKKILLIKGEDDLRQDAVMQQVFDIVNTLLEKDPITSRNKLLIRTYKVVPMSRRSGVLEWCEGTLPIGHYLTGTSNTGAHSKYRPQDISCAEARRKLQRCHELKMTNRVKLETFLSILREFKPVFHYFFTEHYLDPITWYERRLAYTKSVATSSMVGYILGLGDRHVQNILIDKNTAEVIHIDFGIAFDQGKALPTPETIPFRLTQDIIAGFGSSGVEGIFRRCCEKTMQLLRDNQETLLTILEVLLCDPLYSWTTPASTQAGASRDTTINGAASGGLAARALLGVGSKLAGTEGAAGGVAVRGHVALLLRAAADPANLCRLFPGWQPYL